MAKSAKKSTKKAAKKASKRGSSKGYRVLVLTKTGADAYTVRHAGRLAKGLSKAEVLDILKHLAPRKTTTAVAITKTGSVHLAARAKKVGGSNKTSRKIARIAAKKRPRTSKKK
jgi:hypothetical protein